MATAAELDVIGQFRKFYEEVRDARAMAMDLDATDVEPAEPDGPPGLDAIEAAPGQEGARAGRGGRARINPIIGQLVAALEQQSLDFAGRGGNYGTRIFSRIIYVMAAFADDVMLSFPWPGRDDWVRNPLEARLFGSKTAGETIFHDIDDHLRAYQYGRSDIAKAYLMVLALGFEGRYRERDAAPILSDYRRRLFLIAYDREPSIDTAGDVVQGEVYRHTQQGGMPQRMPYVRPWIVGCVVVLAVYVVLTQIIWEYETAALWPKVQSVLTSLGAS